MRTRLIEPRDRQTWAEMRAELWPDEDPDLIGHETLTHFSGRELGAAVFIAEDVDNRAIGFLELALRPYAEGCTASPVPFVEGWFVAPHARHRGAGRALMQAAEHWAITRGFKELGSDTQLTNGASQDIHARLGFEEVERLVSFRKPLKV